MLLDHERLIGDLATRLSLAATPIEACREAVGVFGRHVSGAVAVLLQVNDRLRCVAATGSWHVFSSVAPGAGVPGRVFLSGKTEVITDVQADPDYIPLDPDVSVEICTPIVGGAGHPVGVLNLEWNSPIDLDQWRRTAEEVASRLGTRIEELGGGPAESRSEKLLRHAVAFTNASSQWDLMAAAIEAARDVSGLGAAILLLAGPRGLYVGPPTVVPGDLEARMRSRLAHAGKSALADLTRLAHRHGASYTLGESGPPPAAGYDVVVGAGVRTLIAVPLGPRDGGGVLLVADGRLLRPDPTTVNLMELLAAQAWTCLDRLRTLQQLHERAISDPLTGLRHHGPFGERIATATPGRTALLTIDVDEFKTVNDMYGHQAGDELLVGLARALEAALRQGDELYRIGGDEFVAVVDVPQPEEAVRIAERLATAARRTGRTISVGVAMQRDGEPAEDTLRRADVALYDVKRHGRDGVRLAAL
ncbi:MAG TPA: diguanylate cyclase [Micromonosporaceae bacterium]|nr:diguanylate cyclase [Micromonosporaceae bacterium]